MSTLKFTVPGHWARIEQHLRKASGERFAFALTDVLRNDPNGPVLEVVDVVLIDDREVHQSTHGWSIKDHALDQVHNRAITSGRGLVEFHNHYIGPPQFSRIDETNLEPMAGYVLDLLDGTPYGAAVWAEGSLWAEWWRPTEAGGVERRPFDTVVSVGTSLRVLNARAVEDERFTRQLPLLGDEAQASIGSLRVALVGAGGTGSHVAAALAYLGFRNVLIFDDDLVETTNLNRMVTADHADIGSPKQLVARRRMRAIDPLIKVGQRPGITVAEPHPELHDVDLIIGCVDHDGPRHRLNQIAVDSRVPYLDIATGADHTAEPAALGGRVVLVLPDGPCLSCLDELDPAEIARWAKSAEQQALDRRHGYGTGSANPSVVYLNGLTVHAALVELAAWLSGSRPPATWLDVDLVGSARQPGTQVGPRQVAGPREGCIDCGGVRRSRSA
ncbi:ThiF family adenylyltransferase [Amycolatopsis sp. A133]|uniref:ThiF family adenylyltransferase n=1 Tax=Amycolatopsis sp. A133 TaxID=3064472 RepID=UPI0027EC06C6|nr:ThiF family adenylyltransferase [Amycolatopsis sp. A133]MDQ7808420.1 ThiF family adenylyltransferase [Amycolatopsis sp. A133]